MTASELPQDVEYVRTTPRFNEETVPAGLLGQHRVAKNTWAILTVHTGALDFVFDEPGPAERFHLEAGQTHVIPPRRLHHLEIDGAVTFDVSFYA